MDTHCSVDFGDMSGDADPCDFWHITTPMARKEHTCTECGASIVIGAAYHRVAWKFEGQVGTDKVCDPCWEAMQEFEYRIFGGSFWDQMYEEWNAGANVQGCINRLVPVEAKTHMHQPWMKWKFAERGRM